MAVTIRDVAALAGVSPATVSRTCNNNPAISAETREKVWQAIAQLGYQVTSSGSGAADTETGPSGSRNSSGKPQTIGIIMRPQAQKGYDNPFVTRSIRGISQEAKKPDQIPFFLLPAGAGLSGQGNQLQQNCTEQHHAPKGQQHPGQEPGHRQRQQVGPGPQNPGHIAEAHAQGQDPGKHACRISPLRLRIPEPADKPSGK